MRDALYDELNLYKPWNEQEENDIAVLKHCLYHYDNVYSRENAFVHMTASAWIINHNATKVLMNYHNLYQSWSWCGGHCDGNQNLRQVAIKEGLEETGLQRLVLFHVPMFSIDVLPVCAHQKHNKFISAHLHLNITYLCQADEKAELRVKQDENSSLCWIPVNQLADYVNETNMLIIYQKLIEKTKLFFKLMYI